jgi:hypothetical protein
MSTHGVSFAVDETGDRSTTAVARDVVADALRAVDPVGADAAARETAWRSRYLLHFRRLVEAGLPDAGAWHAVADAGLDGVRLRMVVASDDGDLPLTSLADAPGTRSLATLDVRGGGEPLSELVLPYRGRRLTGGALEAQLEAWERAGVLEPTAAAAVRDVAAHPEWLRLEGRTVAVLGAGAEMGPLGPLLRWGATVAAVDLPTPSIWDRVLRTAHEAAGRLLVPVAPGTEDAGVDLLAEVPETADWLAGLDGRLLVGNYLYADGGTHVRVSMAADALASRVTAARPETGLAFLATPTDVFAVPGEAVEHSGRAYAERSGTAKLVGRPLRWVSRGRLLHRQYAPGADPGVSDCLVQRTPGRTAGVLPRRALHPHPLRGEEPRSRRGLRRRAPLRRRGLRPVHLQHTDGGAAGARPDDGTGAARASLAGRGARRRARRHLAGAVRAPQCPRPGRPPGPRQRPRLAVPTV